MMQARVLVGATIALIAIEHPRKYDKESIGHEHSIDAESIGARPRPQVARS